LTGLAYSRTESGLLVAETLATSGPSPVSQGIRPRPAARAAGDHGERTGYNVYRYAGSDRPAEFLLMGQRRERRALPAFEPLLARSSGLTETAAATTSTSTSSTGARRPNAPNTAAQQADDLIADWKTREGRSALLPAASRYGGPARKPLPRKAEPMRTRLLTLAIMAALLLLFATACFDAR